MKYFAFCEPDPDRVLVLSELELLDQYWDYWSKMMLKANKSPLITPKNCIQDFCVVHWAWEVPEACCKTQKK